MVGILKAAQEFMQLFTCRTAQHKSLFIPCTVCTEFYMCVSVCVRERKTSVSTNSSTQNQHSKPQLISMTYQIVSERVYFVFWLHLADLSCCNNMT